MTKLRASSHPQSLRIIGGRWRGKKLDFPSLEGLRPTGDRIRETLFNWLMPNLPKARCLDLFAGSGALGLEALSRGAESTLFIDREIEVINTLKKHLHKLNCTRGETLLANSLQWLSSEQARQHQGFNIVFIDPPFGSDYWSEAAEALEHHQLLSPQAAIYLESPRNQRPSVPENWRRHRQKVAGNVCYNLYCRD